MSTAIVLNALKNIVMSLFGERVIAKMMFGAAKWLAAQSETNIDDDIVKEWTDAYYGKAGSTRQAE